MLTSEIIKKRAAELGADLCGIGDIRGIIEISSKDDEAKQKKNKRMSKAEKEKLIEKLTREMKEAAKILDFEHAAFVRDRIEKLRNSK